MINEEYSSDVCLSLVNFEGSYFGCRHWEKWRRWTQRKCILEESMQKKYFCPKRDEKLYSRSQMDIENCWEYIIESENPLWGGNNVCGVKTSMGNFQDEPKESQPTEAKDDAEVLEDFWSIQGRHLSSSQWTSSSTLCVERRNIPYSMKITLTWPGLLTQIWMCSRRTCVWLFECGCESKLIRILDTIHKVHIIERKTNKRTYVVPGRDWQRFKQLHEVWTKIGKAAYKREKQ